MQLLPKACLLLLACASRYMLNSASSTYIEVQTLLQGRGVGSRSLPRLNLQSSIAIKNRDGSGLEVITLSRSFISSIAKAKAATLTDTLKLMSQPTTLSGQSTFLKKKNPLEICLVSLQYEALQYELALTRINALLTDTPLLESCVYPGIVNLPKSKVVPSGAVLVYYSFLTRSVLERNPNPKAFAKVSQHVRFREGVPYVFAVMHMTSHARTVVILGGSYGGSRATQVLAEVIMALTSIDPQTYES
ncbi:hypothetical protein EV702DRAFT_1051083 [Suillus placidus]|uniref:Uncharacterized protein n=1 Tax=Suillus placidus TaxID=48579 RepID=A0A9P6ZGJ8_9AGAM|nr:hypothetical protein EV702DRAFT_1051083 [Suillus placidus]